MPAMSKKKDKSKLGGKKSKDIDEDGGSENEENAVDSEIGKMSLSVFQMIKNRLQSNNQRVLVHRVYYVAKLAPEKTPTQAVDYLESVVQQVTDKSPNGQLIEPFTCMGLVYPTQTLHVVEGSVDALLQYLSFVDPKASRGMSPFSVVKVVCFAHDVSTRCFTTWTLRIIDIAAAIFIGGGDDSSEPITKTASDLIGQVIRLSKYIQETPPERVKTILDNLHEKAGAYLPAQDTVAALIATNDKSVRIASEFVENFKRPVLEGFPTEIIWPIDLNVSPHNWSLMV